MNNTGKQLQLMTNRFLPLRRFIRPIASAVALMAVAQLQPLSRTFAAAIHAPAPSAVKPHLVHANTHINPHLKGVDPPIHESREHEWRGSREHEWRESREHEWLEHHHAWHHWWYYHPWIAVHRGLGTIRGFVHSSSGAPMQGVHVVLRKPGGRIFVRYAMKHITSTDAGGNFVMAGVRAGGYRVLASRGRAKGHVQVGVQPGSVATVSVRI